MLAPSAVMHIYVIAVVLGFKRAVFNEQAELILILTMWSRDEQHTRDYVHVPYIHDSALGWNFTLTPK